MSRLLKRDSGEVLIDGKDILKWDNKELAKKIAILRQSNNINIRLTIRELVSFGRFPHSQGNLKEEDYKYIDEAIEYMKLKEFEDRYLDELSGGQRQRAYIAMVIAQNMRIEIRSMKLHVTVESIICTISFSLSYLFYLF